MTGQHKNITMRAGLILMSNVGISLVVGPPKAECVSLIFLLFSYLSPLSESQQCVGFFMAVTFPSPVFSPQVPVTQVVQTLQVSVHPFFLCHLHICLILCFSIIFNILSLSSSSTSSCLNP